MKNLTSVEEGKTNAIISYITLIGTIIAIVLNNSKKNEFTSFHIRQMVGLNLLYFINHWIVYTYAGWLAGGIMGVIVFVLWFIGFMGVINGDEKKVPIFGDYFQDWFKSL